MTTHDSPRVLRQYLLGDATEDESTAIEREYFDRDESLQAVSDVEDDLIADYLEGRLTSDERDRFERHYLASARHRTRVAIVRALRRTAFSRRGDSASAAMWQRVVSTRMWPLASQLAAAVALVALGIAAWTFNSSRTPGNPRGLPHDVASQSDARTSASQQAQPPQRAEAPPPRRVVVVALAIAPLNVRSGGEPATLTIPDDADVVALELQDEAGAAKVERGRAILRTVSGREVWAGATTDGGRPRPEIIARLEIPATAFSADDYIVALFAVDASGRETERNRYFFRVRQR
jgi:hypothetical protein